MGSCRNHRYWHGWLPYWAVMLALWQGPIPIVHQHDIGPEDLSYRPLLWEHFVRYHGSLLEKLPADPKCRVTPSEHLHVGWHWHFVLPGFPDEDGCPQNSGQQLGGNLLVPVTPFAMILSNFLCRLDGALDNGPQSELAAALAVRDFRAGVPRDFLVTLFSSASWRAWSGIARC